MSTDETAARIYAIEQAVNKVKRCLDRVNANFASNQHIMPYLIDELSAANQALEKLVGA